MTTEDEAKAKTIVESWYWQMAEGHNFRWKSAIKSMTLFYESAPLESDVAQLVIEYLKSREGVTEFVITNKKWTFDKPWNAKDCWYQTVPSEKWAGTESTKVRVYWALVQNGDEAADGPYTVENGCKYKVSHSYYWDVSSQPTLPTSSSGVQYSIQGFTRDRETGLFTYIVEKRETVEQSIPLYESAKTIFEDVSEQQFLGVKQGAVAGRGLPASVGNGERVERHITKNPDCTSDITNRKIKDKKVEQARVVAEKKLRGTSIATTDRNLTPGEVAAKTATQQEVGETRTIEKTDTDFRNLTVEKTTPPTLPLKLAKSCEKETSVHTDTTVELVQAGAADRSVEQTVEPNKRKTVSVRKNDDGKTADKTTTEQTWSEKTGGGSSNSGGGVVTSTTERKENTTTTPSATPGVNKVVEIEETPNDHGSKTTVRRTTTYKPNVKSATASDGGHTVEVESGINATGAPSVSGGTNVSCDVSVSPNDHGSLSFTKRKTTHKPSTRKGTASDSGHTVEVESGINATAAPSVSGGTNVSCDVSVSPNDHGSLSFTKRKTTYKPQSGIAHSNLPTERAQTVVRSNTTADPTSPFGSASLSLNDHGSKTTSVTTITPLAISSGWRTWTRTVKSPRGTYTYNCGMIVFRNQKQIPAMAGRHDYHPSISINQYGLYDGAITYADLTNFEENGGQGGVYGGIQEGSITIDGVSHSTKAFYGYGNEGTEAAVRANQVIVKGVSLPHRTYFTS